MFTLTTWAKPSAKNDVGLRLLRQNRELVVCQWLGRHRQIRGRAFRLNLMVAAAGASQGRIETLLRGAQPRQDWASTQAAGESPGPNETLGKGA